ncbi:MAG TPA: hypothetical protein VFD30_16860 [Terriglobia bacterium]|jgi:hypothetical protein|nr:hypothetical protein [Terriglobia bacterium]
MQTVHLSSYIIVLIWVLIAEGLGIYWHVMRASQKLGKILKALEQSGERK